MLQVTHAQKQIMLVRLRNPWGATEWNGAWSDSSSEWNQMSAAERNEFGLVVENDGEFWYGMHLFCVWHLLCAHFVRFAAPPVQSVVYS